MRPAGTRPWPWLAPSYPTRSRTRSPHPANTRAKPAELGPVDVQVDEVVGVVRFLLHTGDNVKLGPEILVRTMRNPVTSCEQQAPAIAVPAR
jgi:hypothetical protein